MLDLLVLQADALAIATGSTPLPLQISERFT